MSDIVNEERKDYVLLDLSDYIKLKKISELKISECKTTLTGDEIIFLSALLQELNADESTVTIINDAVKLDLKYNNKDEIHSTFDLSICPKYYNRISRFIDEII